MSIIVQCDCGKRFKAKEALAGKRVRCPGCSNPVTVGGDGPRKGKPGPTADAIDADAALLKYEAAQKKKQEDAAAEAARQEEKNKLIASYDQFAGRKKQKEQKKGELAETGAPKKPTVAMKAADAGGTILSNPLVKYLIIAGLLGAGAYGSVKLVQFIVTYTDDQVAVGPKPIERVEELATEIRKDAAAGRVDDAQAKLDEILKIYPDYKTEKPRDYDDLAGRIEKARKNASRG